MVTNSCFTFDYRLQRGVNTKLNVRLEFHGHEHECVLVKEVLVRGLVAEENRRLASLCQPHLCLLPADYILAVNGCTDNKAMTDQLHGAATLELKCSRPQQPSPQGQQPDVRALELEAQLARARAERAGPHADLTGAAANDTATAQTEHVASEQSACSPAGVAAAQRRSAVLAALAASNSVFCAVEAYDPSREPEQGGYLSLAPGESLLIQQQPPTAGGLENIHPEYVYGWRTSNTSQAGWVPVLCLSVSA